MMKEHPKRVGVQKNKDWMKALFPKFRILVLVPVTKVDECESFRQRGLRTSHGQFMSQTKIKCIVNSVLSFLLLQTRVAHFFNGTSGFRRTTLQAHSRSKTHHTCSEAYHTREHPDAAPMGRALRNFNSQTQEKLRKLLDSAYFISKENLSFAKFPDLCKLQMKNGLELGETYPERPLV